MTRKSIFKARQKFGKYVIEKRLGEGGFAIVYQARDTIEGIRVALKVPHSRLVTDDVIELFRHEVRLAARLEHPNILPLKYADFIEGRFVIVTALGEETLDARLQRRMSTETCLDFIEQMLDAVACAHHHRIIHCDIKPENFLVFPDHTLRLADFGIARVAQHTLKGSGAGTVGYIAPEQAMGRPSFRSDVFSCGLIMYRMMAGVLPEWPFDWPCPGYARLRQRAHPDLVAMIRKSIELNARKRYRDGEQMLSVFLRIKPSARRFSRNETPSGSRSSTRHDWEKVRKKAFTRRFGKQLQAVHDCRNCGGPVSESMKTCPWCGKPHKFKAEDTKMPAHCPRCQRGMKLDWRFCPWCYGRGFELTDDRQYADRRYTERCSNRNCERKELMPFMKYCPWCNRRVRRKWRIDGSADCCHRCGWGVVGSFWSYCPWCSAKLKS